MPLNIEECAERRQVTILHCDIVNSTEVVDSLDPEEVLMLMEGYLDRWIELVEQHRGTFADYTGDGFQAYFGYPHAHEDAAIDAVSAALAVSNIFSDTENPVQKELQCRIGVATGRVVVAQAGVEKIARTLVAFGSVPCLAARLEQAANPGHILIDSATVTLAQGQFVLREVGTIPAKGFKNDVLAWEVVRKRRPGHRFDSSQLSPYVGRDQQLRILKERWQLAAVGSGQAVLVGGEPGIGKSRLAFEFEQSVANQVGQVFRFQCSNLNTSTPLHPWFHWLQQIADISEQDDASVARSKLRARVLEQFGFSEKLGQISEVIMGHATALAESIEGIASEKLLEMLQQTLVEDFARTAARAPILLFVEDVHWMDASTEGAIELLLERIGDYQILLIMTARPDNAPEFTRANVTKLQLSPLDERAVDRLVETFLSETGGEPAANALMTTIRKCEGNPLYVEEFTKHYLEKASDAQPDGLPPRASRRYRCCSKAPSCNG